MFFIRKLKFSAVRMINSQNKQFDIVVFGASGYTGQFVVEYVARAVDDDFRSQCEGENRRRIRWAVAGRNANKVNATLASASKITGFDLTGIPVIVCDTKDELSLNNMAAQAKVVVNCVGPYRFHGEPVVRACVQNGAHHVDVSGEPEYLESMQLKYDEEARKKGVYIVGSCGFDSIPSDVGQTVLARAMDGPVNSIETYVRATVPADESGPMINFATWQSAIYGFAMQDELKKVRKALFPDKLPKLRPSLERRPALHKNPLVGSWCLEFPGSDRSVMNRTQRMMYQEENCRPAQIGCYVQVSSFVYAILIAVVGIVFAILAKSKFGRTLLETYPQVFSLGAVSKRGPSRRMAENTDFEMKLFGLGWDGKDKGSLSDLGKATRKVVVTVRGKNVGYGSTSECLVQSAIVVLRESDRMPGSGGVYTPGFAFKNTSLVDRLCARGVTFDVEIMIAC